MTSEVLYRSGWWVRRHDTETAAIVAARLTMDLDPCAITSRVVPTPPAPAPAVAVSTEY